MRLTQERLKELLNYDSKTGIFTRKSSGKGIRKNSVAGSKRPDGYVITSIKGKMCFAHRLAWLYVYGYMPEHEIDHINRITDDNRIENLREVSHQCNMRNTGNRKDNTSGVKGIVWAKHANKWHVQIKVNRKNKHLGIYTDFDEAVCVRLAAEQCVGWSGCDDKSPAYQYVKNNI